VLLKQEKFSFVCSKQKWTNADIVSSTKYVLYCPDIIYKLRLYCSMLACIVLYLYRVAYHGLISIPYNGVGSLHLHVILLLESLSGCDLLGNRVTLNGSDYFRWTFCMFSHFFHIIFNVILTHYFFVLSHFRNFHYISYTLYYNYYIVFNQSNNQSKFI